MQQPSRRRGMVKRVGFTLIELLIVVAIIAILAAIAVPNFLEAQTRSKVSRCLADMRTLKTGLESYKVDTNKYPETDFGGDISANEAGVGLYRLTTPVAFLTSINSSPFEENQFGNTGANRHSNNSNIFLYVRAEWSENTPDPDGNNDNVSDDFATDRVRYLLGQPSVTPGNIAIATRGEYQIRSVGPDNVDDNQEVGVLARVYDPTNGTVSAGDVVTFQDTTIPASQQGI